VVVVVEYGIGMYVNAYLAVPRADHGGSLASAISNGPAILSIHAVIGLLLGLGALAVLLQAVIARHWGVTASSALGLLALAFASVTGTSFTSTGDAVGDDWSCAAVLRGKPLRDAPRQPTRMSQPRR
jgi:hypothetical protein